MQYSEPTTAAATPPPYVVQNAPAAPWLFNGLGMENGAALGTARYGIEFDMIAPESPPGTDSAGDRQPGPGDGTILGEMSYYETPAGAKVFAAGTLSFGGSDNPSRRCCFRTSGSTWWCRSRP